METESVSRRHLLEKYRKSNNQRDPISRSWAGGPKSIFRPFHSRFSHLFALSSRYLTLESRPSHSRALSSQIMVLDLNSRAFCPPSFLCPATKSREYNNNLPLFVRPSVRIQIDGRSDSPTLQVQSYIYNILQMFVHIMEVFIFAEFLFL